MISALPSPCHLPRVCDGNISGILKLSCLLVQMFLFLGTGPFVLKFISKTVPERQDLSAQCNEY